MSEELKSAVERAVESYDAMTALLGPMADGPILPLVEFARQQLADIAERDRREKEDAEPIDCPWLCTLGFRFVAGEKKEHCGGWVLCLVDFDIDEERGMYGEELRLVQGGSDGVWHVEVRSRARDWSEGVGLAEYKTRGQVLRLLEVLGIERKGG